MEKYATSGGRLAVVNGAVSHFRAYNGVGHGRPRLNGFRGGPPRGRSGSRFPGVGDESRAALPAQVGPGPFEEDEEAIAEADQEQDVHEEPGEPRGQAVELKAAHHRDRGGAADGRHAALVAVAERAGRQTGETS